MDKTPVSILIVDDKPANLLALEAVLGQLEYRLVRANSGAEAIGLVEKEPFAAVLLDIQMPGLDGYETARRIKRMPHGRDIPIMFVTAVYKEDSDMRRGYEAGALDYFAKPLDPELVRAKVRIYADLYRMTHEARERDRLLAALRDREAAERALDRVLEGVSEGVIITDATGAVTRANGEARWIWSGAAGKTPRGKEDLVGWWVDSGKTVLPDEWAMSKALKTGKVEMNEPIAIKCLDGRHRIILESASPLTDEKGSTIGVVAVLKVIAVQTLREGALPGAAPRGEDEHGAPMRH